MDPHPPTLYRADATATGVDGFAGVDDKSVRHYEEQGYLVVRSGFSAEESDAAYRELQAMTRSDDPGCDAMYFEGNIRAALENHLPDGTDTGVSGQLKDLAMGRSVEAMPALPPEVRAGFVRKFQGFCDAHPPLKALLNKPDLVDLVTRLVGEPVLPLQEMAMIKGPEGREKPWHQDHAYFNYPVETNVIGVWVALDTVTPENGCMHVLAGGHKLGPRVHWRRRDWQICDDETMDATQTAVPMTPGDILLFDSKLPHGTPTNHSDRHRWALQYHYIAASAQKTDEDARLAVFGSEGKDVTC
jgi:phytanoyl-CoA hydroxylase